MKDVYLWSLIFSKSWNFFKKGLNITDKFLKQINIFKLYYPKKNIGVTLLRNIVLSTKFNAVPHLKAMKTYAKRMGTSVACMFSFYKQSLDQNGDMIIQEIQELDSTDSE